MLILLSNDDGVSSEGLQSLRKAFSKTDDVWVVAPESERTCIAHAITLHKPLRIKDLGDRVFSTNGTPADSVLLALKVVLPRKPDLVISGINKGPNMGQDVSYSGTVAAAREGAFSGCVSIAASLNVGAPSFSMTPYDRCSISSRRCEPEICLPRPSST